MPKHHQPSLQRSSTLPHHPRPSSHEIEDDTTSYSRASYSQESSDQSKWSYPLLLSSPSPKHQTKRIGKKIWNPEEEALMLEEMIKFQAKCLKSFTKIVKSKLSLNDLSSTELNGEILRIKSKFKRRYREDKHKKFKSDAKQNVFNLSKLIWGEEFDAEAAKGKEKGETSIVGGDHSKTKVEEVEFMDDEKRARLKRRMKPLKRLEEQGRGIFKRIRRWIKLMEE